MTALSRLHGDRAWYRRDVIGKGDCREYRESDNEDQRGFKERRRSRQGRDGKVSPISQFPLLTDQNSRNNQPTMFKPKALTVPSVFQSLTEIAKATGNAVRYSSEGSIVLADPSPVADQEGQHYQEAAGSLSGQRGQVYCTITRRQAPYRPSRQDFGSGTSPRHCASRPG